MNEEVNKILHEANKVAIQETAHLSSKHRDAAVNGRATRYIRLGENSAAEEYYKKYGRHFDNREGNSAHTNASVRVMIYLMIAFLANIIFYLPIYFLLSSWGDISKHDAVFITVAINVAIGTIACGLWVEHSTKRLSFKAGMRAEADNHIVSKYHIAKDKLDTHYTSKGHLPDYDFEWND